MKRAGPIRLSTKQHSQLIKAWSYCAPLCAMLDAIQIASPSMLYRPKLSREFGDPCKGAYDTARCITRILDRLMADISEAEVKREIKEGKWKA